MRRQIHGALLVLYLIGIAILVTGCQTSPPLSDVSSLPSSSPTLDVASAHRLRVSRVDGPSDDSLSVTGDVGGWIGPVMDFGDVTHDGQSEIVVARMPLPWLAPEDGNYALRPAVGQWLTATIHLMTANWTNVPGISSFTSATIQGHVLNVKVVDLDLDGKQEVVVGTASDLPKHRVGAVYIFQWNGDQFVTRYANYCLGEVIRIDMLGRTSQGYPRLLLSVANRPSQWPSYISEKTCPLIARDSQAASAGLYVLEWDGKGYQTTEVRTDNMYTALVTNLPGQSTTTVVRLAEDSSGVLPMRLTLAGAYLVDLGDGHQTPLNQVVDLEGYPLQLEAADLDNDGVPELVLLYVSNPNNNIESPTQMDVFRWEGKRYSRVWSGLADPLHRSVRRLVVGDMDNDGQNEIVTDYGIVYKWIGRSLVDFPEVARQLHERILWDDIYGRMYEMGISDVDGDGKNELWFDAGIINWGEPFMSWPRYLFAAHVEVQPQ